MTNPSSHALQRERAGRSPSGEVIERLTLTHAGGAECRLLTWGAAIECLLVPDREGTPTDVVLGLASPDDYARNNPFYIGTAVGRTAGRIFPAEIEIDGHPYALTRNEGDKHLHGGPEGLHNRLWTVSDANPSIPSVRLECELPDGLEGYPGTVRVGLTCEWATANVLRLEYEASTDRPTLFNPTRHDYFNLGGHASGPIGSHIVRLPHTRYLPIDDDFVESLPPRRVEGTCLDFRAGRALGDPLVGMESRVGGINYAFLNAFPALEQPAAEVHHPATGIRLRFRANQQTLQFYTGNVLDPSIPAKTGARYDRHHGFCLEAMHFANGIHTPAWASPGILRPGENFRHIGIYEFDTV